MMRELHITKPATYEFALQEPALAIAPVFLALQKKRSRAKLDVVSTFGTSQLRWRGPDALGISEQSVYLGLLAIAGQQERRIIPSSPTSQGGIKLLAKLGIGDLSSMSELCVLKASWTEIAIAAGSRSIGGQNRENVKAAVQRLAETTLWERNADKEYQCRILSCLITDDDFALILLNPRATSALIGGQYSFISLDERRRIKGEPGKALHAWLSGTLKPGHSRRYTVDALQVHVWGGASDGTTLRKRRSKLVEVIQDIGRLEKWCCKFDEGGMVDIHRAGGLKKWVR